METLTKLFILIATIFGMAVVSGTILWLIWGSCVPYVFPTLVKQGYLIENISWWQAVTLTWICTILFRSTTSNSSKEK